MAGIFDTGIFDTGIFDTASAALSLQPPLLTNSQAFYGPSVTPGAVTLSHSRLSNTQTFFASTVSAGAVTLSPSLLSNTQAFYAASVAPGAVSLQPSSLENSQSFFSHAVSNGGGVLRPALHENVQAFYSPTVQPGPASIEPPMLQSGQQFFSLVVGPRSAGGGYDDEPKRKKRYVAKVGDRLVSFARKQDAIEAALRTDTKEEIHAQPDQPVAEKPAAFPLKEIERLARERNALEVYKQRLQRMQYEALLRQYEDWQDEQDIDDILRLYRQSIEDILGQI